MRDGGARELTRRNKHFPKDQPDFCLFVSKGTLRCCLKVVPRLIPPMARDGALSMQAMRNGKR